MKHTVKRIAAAAAAAALFLALLAGCGTAAQSSTIVQSQPGSSETQNIPAAGGLGAAEDLDASWDEASATILTLNGSTASVAGSGASVNGSTVTITAAGTYVLRGQWQGSVAVQAGGEDLVRLVLDGAHIICDETAPVYLQSGRKLLVILADGTQNTLTDSGGDYTFYDVDKAEPNGALFSKNDLTINGKGRLNVNAGYNIGISAKGSLILVSGEVTVKAAGNGIRGRDALVALGGSYTIEAGNDGLQSNNDGGEDVGFILIEGGTYSIYAAHDAVQAETTLVITGGEFNITTAGGANGAAPSADGSDSYKGLKAQGDITITGGSFVFDTYDDAVHSNASVAVNGGEFTIATGDDGMHADENLVITDGNILITQSYEGLEGATVSVSGGIIDLTASDDGINAAGGSDSTGGGGMFGGDRFGGSGVSEEYWIDISGGHITVRAGGDGIDSNGSVTMSGGTLLVHGPTSGMDGALDYELTFTLTGGTIVAVGSSQMAETPTASASTQASLALFYTGTQAAGTTLRLEDESGNALLEFTSDKSFTSAVLTTPQLAEGGSYTLYTGGTKTSVTLSGMVTSINENGGAASGGMGGGFGGGRGGPGGTPPDGMELPEGMQPPEGMNFPTGGEMPRDMGSIPEGTPPAKQ